MSAMACLIKSLVWLVAGSSKQSFYNDQNCGFDVHNISQFVGYATCTDHQRIYIWGITGQSPGSSLSTICRPASRTSMAVECMARWLYLTDPKGPIEWCRGWKYRRNYSLLLESLGISPKFGRHFSDQIVAVKASVSKRLILVSFIVVRSVKYQVLGLLLDEECSSTGRMWETARRRMRSKTETWIFLEFQNLEMGYLVANKFFWQWLFSRYSWSIVARIDRKNVETRNWGAIFWSIPKFRERQNKPGYI